MRDTLRSYSAISNAPVSPTPLYMSRTDSTALDYIRQEGSFIGRSPNGPLLLVLDINMPRVDGVEVLRQIKQNEAYAKLPIIMLTTTDDPREIDRCYELGCSVYITKPVEYEAFVEAVKRLGLLLQVVRIPPEVVHS